VLCLGETISSRKNLLKKKCIAKNRNKRVTIGQRKDCKKKKVIVRPLRRKKHRKKVIIIRKKIIVTAPQGIQGSPGIQGPSGLQGEQGPPGPVSAITIIPSVNRYYYIASSDFSDPVALPANEFTNDEGIFTTAFTGTGQNSYSNLYLNGILQEGSLYNLNEDALTINPNNQTIFSGTPIILETIQFFAQSSVIS
jgi:hypothetical protein